MANNNITLTLNITKNGVKCENPLLTIFDSDIIAFPCGKKLDKNGNLKITLPNDVFGKESCIKGYIQCEECDNCGDRPFEACLCNDSSDCSECESCESGVCVSFCDSGEMCVNNTCSDCLNEDDCPAGFECLNGECVCNGYINNQGFCANCLDRIHCDPCQECINGNCVDRDCGSQVCDPTSDNCVDCNDGGDCNIPNSTCINNKCVCQDGYIKDISTGLCIPEPECNSDTDCPACTTCVNGDCQDINCPADYACNSETGKCEYNPCPDTPCTTGLDCGEGCGCNEDSGMCEPCINTPDGLGCNNGNCGGTCSNSSQCGEGCTCYKGECVSCDNFPCDNDDCSNLTGCGCNNGNCEGDGNSECDTTFEAEVDKCKVTAELNQSSEGCACPVMNLYSENVSAEVEGQVVKFKYNIYNKKGIANNNLSAALLPTTDESNLYSNIADNEEASSGIVSGKVSYWVETFEIFTNEEGEEFEVDHEYILVNVPQLFSRSFSNLGRVLDIEFEVLNVGSSIEGYGNNRILDYRIEFTQSSDFVYPNDCRYKAKQSILYIKEDSEVPRSNSFYTKNKNIYSSYKRNPLFNWFKSTTTEYNEDRFILDGGYNSGLFRSEYIDDDEDTLFGPNKIPSVINQDLSTNKGEFWGNYWYKVTTDCSCNDIEEKDLGKIVFCAFDDVTPELTYLECNKKVQISNFEVCLSNQWRGLWDVTAPKQVQAYWALELNGQVVETFVNRGGILRKYNVLEDSLVQANGTVVNNIYETSDQEEITSLRVVQMYNDGDSAEVCSYTDNIPDINKEVNLTYECLDNGTYTAILSPISDTLRFDTIEVSGLNQVTSSVSSRQITLTDVQPDENYNFKITYTNGCEYEDTLFNSCCDNVNLSISSDNCASSATLTAELTGTQATAMYQWTVSNGTVLGSTQLSTINIVADGEGDTIVDLVATIGSCEKTASYTVDLDQNIVFSYEGDTFLCPPINATTLNLKLAFDGSDYILQTGDYFEYTINSGTTNNLPTSSLVITQNAGDSQVIKINSLKTSGGCTYNIDETINVQFGVKPSATITSVSKDESCVESTVDITISGTQGAEVNLIAGGSIIDTLTIGSSGTATKSLTSLVQGNITYTLGDPGTSSCGLSITPNPKTVSWQENSANVTMTTNCIGTNSIEVTISPTSGTIIESVSGASGQTYTLVNNSFTTSNTSDSLTVNLSNGLCTRVLNLNLPGCNCVQPIIASAVNSPQTTQINQNVALELSITGGVEPYNIQWYETISGSDTPITGNQSSIIVQSSTVGTRFYKAVIDDQNTLCPAATVSFTVNYITPTCDCTMVASYDSSSCTASVILTGSDCVNFDRLRLYKDTGILNTWFNPPSGSYSAGIDSDGTSHNYSFALEDGPCSNIPTTVTSVTCVQDLTVSLNRFSTTTCESVTATASGGVSPYSYQWFKSSDNSILATTPGFQASEDGDYHVVVTDSNNDTIQSSNCSVSGCTVVPTCDCELDLQLTSNCGEVSVNTTGVNCSTYGTSSIAVSGTGVPSGTTVASGSTYTAPQSGTYTFTLNTQGITSCTNKQESVTVNIPTYTIGQTSYVDSCENITPVITTTSPTVGIYNYTTNNVNVPSGTVNGINDVIDMSNVSDSSSVVLTFTDNTGCEVGTINYSKLCCEECTYTLKARDPQTKTTTLDTFVENTTGVFSHRRLVESYVEKSCNGSITESNVSQELKDGVTAIYSTTPNFLGDEFLSFNVINQGTPQVLNVPSNVDGTDNSAIASWLNTFNLGTTFTAVGSNTVRHVIDSNNTGGFDRNLGVTVRDSNNNIVNRDYSSGTVSIGNISLGENIQDCGEITTNNGNSLGNYPKMQIDSYNTVSFIDKISLEYSGWSSTSCTTTCP